MKYPNRDELIVKAKELREGGLFYSEIAEILGVGSHSTISRWLDPAAHQKSVEYGRIYCETHRELMRERYEKRISDPVEREAERNRLREYRINNKERVAERDRLYAENNREKIRAYQKDYSERNKDKLKVLSRIYYEEHKDNYLENSRRRKKKIKEGFKIKKDQYDAIFEEQGGLCFYCGEPIVRTGDYNAPNYYNVEHINPVDNGGWHKLDNIVYACKKCNSSKQARLVEDWMPEILPKIAANPRLRYDIEEAHMRWLV